jgi:hypothetical protein
MFYNVAVGAAVALAPIVLQAHQTDPAFTREIRRLGQGQLTFRFEQPRLEHPMHGFDIALARRVAPRFGRAERLHVHIGYSGLIKAGGQ